MSHSTNVLDYNWVFKFSEGWIIAMRITLETFVRQQNAKNPTLTASEIDWDGRRDAWVKQVEALIHQIKSWLGPLLEEKQLALVEGKTFLQEEYIGRYEVPWLEVLIGKQRARIIPKATLVVGSFGRVDMEGPMGRVLLVLSDTGALPKVEVRISVGDPLSVQSDESEEDEKPISTKLIKKSKWYIVYPGDRQKMTRFSKTVFSDAIQRILRQ